MTVTVIDQALPKTVFDYIKQRLHSADTPYYICTTYATTQDPHSVHWSHSVWDGERKTALYDLLAVSFFGAMEAQGIAVRELLRIRIGVTQITDQEHLMSPHCDHNNHHWVCLLYCTDSSSETVIYKEQYDVHQDLSSDQYLTEQLKNQLTEWQRIQTKENRMVIFNGLHYHSSPKQTDQALRIVVNYNFR